MTTTQAQAEQRSAGTPTVPPRIRVKGLQKTFHTRRGNVTALADVSLDVGDGELVVLLGPSGCGKTTLLRCVAGLERPDEGEIEIHGQTVFSSSQRFYAPPEQRKISMVFQSYALWPHMTVYDNVAYALHNRRVPKAEIRERVMDVLRKVGLEGRERSHPGQLSGGQQQRVALARAIVTGDGVVLFDEPLSNVDAKVRERLRLELLGMQRELGFSALYVTHDQTEATALAHRIAVMNTGVIAQIGTPREIYERPNSRYVADFIGTANELPGTISGWQDGFCRVETAIGPVLGTLAGMPEDKAEGQSVVVLFRPEHLDIEPATASAAGNRWPFQVVHSVFLGSHVEYLLAADGTQLLVRSMRPEPLEEGAKVLVSIEPTRVRVLPK